MNKSVEIIYSDVEISNNSIDYTDVITDYGIKIIRPVGKNYKKQMVWECECGYCHKKFRALPSVVINGHKQSCGCLKTTNAFHRNISNKKSFGDWCIENNRRDILESWDYTLNDETPFNVLMYSKNNKKYWFKCPNFVSCGHCEQHSLHSIVSFHTKDLTCHWCRSFAQWGINNICDDFLEKYWDYDKNNKNPWEITVCSSNKVWIICREKSYHGSYEVSCNKFVNGCRCPYCNKNSGKIHYFDSLGYLYPEILKIWSNKNIKTPYEYAPQTRKKVWFKCNDGLHDDYLQVVANAVNRNFRCPNCVKEMKDSILQKKVTDYINNNYNYTLLHEFNCELKPINPKTGFVLPFDNEIKELKLIIEVMGKQHYEISQFTKFYANKHNITCEDALKEQQWRDEYKKKYVLSHGYEYLDIPYTSEKNDVYRKLIDNKINKILQNK